MAYNNYPMPFQQLAYPTMYQQPMQRDNRIWVQGIEGAKAYMVANNTTVDLWDSEDKKIYIKTADASGVPSIKAFVYDEDTPVNAPDTPKTDFATKDDILSIQKQINDLRGRLEKEKHHEHKSYSNGKQLTK